MSEPKKNKYWDMKMSADNLKTADIFIYGEIVSYVWYPDDVSASSFKDDLDALGDVTMINLYINSPGGDVFEGATIYNMLKRHNAHVNVHIDGLAASIASVIAMAGNTIHMPKNSMMMIHNPWTWKMGNAAELRKAADDLDRIGTSMKQSYLQKTGDKLTDSKLQELLDAESWLSADEAHGFGLCDIVLEANQASASIGNEWQCRYKNVPKMLKKEGNPLEETSISAEEMAMRQRIAEEAKTNLVYYDTVLGGL